MTKRLEIPLISLQRHFGGFLTLYTKDGDNDKKEKRGSLTLFYRKSATAHSVSESDQRRAGMPRFQVRRKRPLSRASTPSIYTSFRLRPKFTRHITAESLRAPGIFRILFSISESFSLAAPVFFQLPQLTLSARTRFLPSFVLTTAIVHQHTHRADNYAKSTPKGAFLPPPLCVVSWWHFPLSPLFFSGAKKKLFLPPTSLEKERPPHPTSCSPFLEKTMGAAEQKGH